MEYLHEFKTQAAFDAYYDGEDYQEPFVGIVEGSSSVYYNKKDETLGQPFTFEFLSGGSLYLNVATIGENDNAFYKLNDGEWVEVTENIEVNVNQGDTVSIKGDGFASTKDSGDTLFSSDVPFNVYGNIMSLISKDDFATLQDMGDYNFEMLFYENGMGHLISAENLLLPATGLTVNCYRGMFQGCENLIAAPALPATTLADECYAYMFCDCFALTTAPVLPATTLSEGCYYCMFAGCPLTTAPALPATAVTENCYSRMFRYCNSLTTAPELPAATLAPYCYDSMFEWCSSLNYIKCLATDISARWCIHGWINGVAESGTFVKSSDMDEEDWGVGIPSGWTVEDA